MKYIYLIIFLITASTSFAQSSASDSIETKKPTLTLATIYSSDANYYGQTSTERLPYVLGNATLKFPVGIFFSASAYKLLDFGSGISGFDFTGGYDFDLSKSLSGGLSYSRSFYPDSSLLLQSTNLNTFSASLSNQWPWLTTGINVDYVPGSTGVLFVTANASKLLDLGSLFSPKDYISFEPRFSVIGSTQRITTTEEIPPSSNGNNGKASKRITLPLIQKSKNPQYRTVESTSFDVLSYNLSLPIAYNRANYMIEASYQVSVLSKAISDSQKPKSFFNLGFYYIF